MERSLFTSEIIPDTPEIRGAEGEFRDFGMLT